MRHGRSVAFVAALLTVACTPPDPKAHFELSEVETYWAVDSPRGETHYIAPVVRFRLKNRTAQPSRSVQAQAVFRRLGEEDQSWGSDWREVAPARTPIPPGGELFVELKSDGRYHTTGTPESMLEHDQFRDVRADIFLREGSSQWTKMTDVLVERRIGSRSAVIPTVPVPPRP